MATSGTPNFPPNYVTLKQLHEKRLREKQQAAEEEERLRKLREAEAEEQARRNHTPATGFNISRHSAVAGPDGAHMSSGNPVRISRAAPEPKKPLRPRRSIATAAGDGPYRQSGPATLNIEPKRKEGREKYKGKGKEGKAGEKPEAVAPEAEEPTVDGQDPRPGVESLMVLKPRKEGRRKEKGKGKGKEGKKPGEEVLELKPETGLVETVPKPRDRKRGDRRGPRQKGECMWVAVVPARNEPEEVVKVVEQFDHLSVNVDKEMHAEEGNVVVAGKGRKSVDGRWRGRNRSSRGFSRRVADCSVPVGNKVVERSEDIVINGGNATCNETHTEENVVMAEKRRKPMAGRGRGRNARFEGLGGFSKRAAVGSVSVNGMVWVKKT